MKNFYNLVIHQLEITEEKTYTNVTVDHMNNLQAW